MFVQFVVRTFIMDVHLLLLSCVNGGISAEIFVGSTFNDGLYVTILKSRKMMDREATGFSFKKKAMKIALLLSGCPQIDVDSLLI